VDAGQINSGTLLAARTGSLTNHSDVTRSGPMVSGQVLIWDGTKWTNGAAASGQTNISDVAVTNASWVKSNNLAAAASSSIGDIVTNRRTVELDLGNLVATNPLVPVQNFPPVPLTSANGKDTNSTARGSEGFSINKMNLWWTQKAFNNFSSHKYKMLILGDSTGADSVLAMQGFFDTNYVWATEPLGFGDSGSSYFDVERSGSGNLGCGQITAANGGDPHWWGQSMSLTNSGAGTHDQTFGIRNSFGVTADTIQFWYFVSNGYGSLTLWTAPTNTGSSNTWTLRATTDCTAGFGGLHATNISIPLSTYYLKVSNSIAGTQGRTCYLWPDLVNNSTNSAKLWVGNVGGLTSVDFLGSGTNTIASILTNFSPDIIIYQETKNVSVLYGFTNLAGLFKTYASNSDVVMIQSQASKSAVNESTADVGSQFQLAVRREIALTNGWGFIDNCTPFNNWSNNIAAGFDLGDSSQIHFTTLGQQISGQIAIRQMGLLDMMANAGALQPQAALRAYAKLSGATFTGDTWVNGTLGSTGVVAQIHVANQQANASHVRFYFTGTGASQQFHIDGNDGTDILTFHFPFATPFIIDSAYTFANTGQDPQLFSRSNPYRVHMTNSWSSGTFSNMSSLEYSNSWLTATNTRKTNISRRGTWEADFTFTDAVGGYPALAVTVEDAGGVITNTWTCQFVAGVAGTATNHYSFRVGTGGIISVTNISTSTATADIVRSRMVWE
jgi:hypothetical protein